jgi:hypothetical protein
MSKDIEYIEVCNRDGLTMFQGSRLVDMGEGKFDMIYFRGDDGVVYLVPKDNISAIMVIPPKGETNE